MRSGGPEWVINIAQSPKDFEDGAALSPSREPRSTPPGTPAEADRIAIAATTTAGPKMRRTILISWVDDRSIGRVLNSESQIAFSTPISGLGSLLDHQGRNHFALKIAS
jgi:hypothetical protein